MCDWGRDVESEKEGLINSIMGATSAPSATKATRPPERLTTEIAAKVALRVYNVKSLTDTKFYSWLQYSSFWSLFSFYDAEP